MAKHEFPPANIYNMDEKGCQLGGGRRSGASRKYILSRHSRQNYKTSSADLELVTIIECVAADGASIPPGIVFQGALFRSHGSRTSASKTSEGKSYLM
jgi:hypothetical protein